TRRDSGHVDKPRYHDRYRAIVVAAIAEVAGLVEAPTARRTILQYRASVAIAGRNPGRTGETTECYGHATATTAIAIATLARSVCTPPTPGTVVEHRTGVLGTE